MSKASEWAKAPTFPRQDLIGTFPPTVEAMPVLYPSAVCCLIKNGYHERVTLLQSEAVAVARWILDTFGEEVREPRTP